MFREFKEFALKGSMVDLAIGLVVGSASSNIVNSVVNGMLVPRIRLLISGTNPSDIPPINVESVIGSIVNFLLIMLIVFALVKTINRMRKGEEPRPVEKECPYCRFNIPVAATRCGHCTSPLETEKSI